MEAASWNSNLNEQKKMQEKAKKELDAIIQSWKDNTEGVVHVNGTDENSHPLQDLHNSFPSGEEEIEGSDFSSLKYLYSSETQPSTSESSSLNGSAVKLSIMSKVESYEEMQLAAQLCHQAEDVLSNKTNQSRNTLCLKKEKSFSVQPKKPKSKEIKAKEIVDSTVNFGTVSNCVEPGTIVSSRSDVSDGLSVDQREDITDSSEKDHLKKHLCNLCGKRYKISHHLTRHIKTAHDNKQAHLCNICNTSFTRSESLIRHLRIHEQRDGADKNSKQGPYKCPKCNKSYQQAYNVTRHLLSHQGIKPFKCTECNKSFTQYTGLSRHLVLHKGSKDFECKECGKTFARLFVLNRHILTHSNDKPYKCFVCSKSFIRASQLSAHMNSHQKKGKRH